MPYVRQALAGQATGVSERRANWFVKIINHKIIRRLGGKKFRGEFYSYSADGFATKNKNLGFMNDSRFAEAYEWSAKTAYHGKQSSWAGYDLRWRAHICVWAATQALKIEGDFVECGVDTGFTSGTILKYLGFASIPRTFFLFDTFNGIPFHPQMTEKEQALREYANSKHYFDFLDFMRAKTASFPNVELVRGVLPGTLDAIEERRVAYLSVDLNNAPAESGVIERIWPQLSPGAVIVIDDYAFDGHEAQYAMWNSFAKKHDLMIATLPTGQGLLIKGVENS